MSRSLTELGLALLAIAAAACGDDAECGAGDAPADGVTVAAGATITFGQFRSGPNNDCTPVGREPVSVTVQGDQTDPAAASRFLVLCLPQPDLIGAQPVPLTDADRVQVVDVLATDPDGCRLELDRERPLAGEVTFSGFCDDGTHPDGYAISFAATVPLLKTCGTDAGPGEPESIDGEIGGRAAVSADP